MRACNLQSQNVKLLGLRAVSNAGCVTAPEFYLFLWNTAASEIDYFVFEITSQEFYNGLYGALNNYMLHPDHKDCWESHKFHGAAQIKKYHQGIQHFETFLKRWGNLNAESPKEFMIPESYDGRKADRIGIESKKPYTTLPTYIRNWIDHSGEK